MNETGKEASVKHMVLSKLAKEYPEVKELLEDNYSLSLAMLWERLKQFDSNHANCQANLADRLSKVEKRLDHTIERTAAKFKELESHAFKDK